MNPKALPPGALLAALFCTGFAALGCELAWIRMGTLLFGSTNTAASTLFAVYFAGLAIGAWVAGSRSQRMEDPLQWFGALELLAATFAAVTPWLFAAVRGPVYEATAWSGGHPVLLTAVRVTTLAVLILLPAALSGAALPLACQHLSRLPTGTWRPAPGLAYALNTLGACAGCLTAGLVLIPTVGVTRTVVWNAGIGAATGALVMALRFWRARHSDISRVIEPDAVVPPSPLPGTSARKAAVHALFFFVGFTALGYEVLWTRFLSLILHNTVYTVTFALASVLLGIALGSGLASAVDRRVRNPAVAFALVSVLTGITVAITLLLPKAAWAWAAGSHSIGMGALICIVILLPASALSGAAFPLAMRLIPDSKVGGKEVGGLLASNTIGGILGALGVGLVLLPVTGSYAVLILLTSLSLVVGLAAASLLDPHRGRRHKVGFAAVGVLTWGLVLGLTPTRLPADYLRSGGELVTYREGVSSFVAVVRSKSGLRLEMDRMWQGQKGRGYQGMAAHIPMHLAPKPREVLVVGLGSGETASRFLGYGLDRLDVVDIEPALHDIVEDHFDGRWIHDPRVRLLHQDGRAFAAHARDTYDIVSVEVGQTFRPQVASFYTVDFYQDVRRLLKPDGLACQFLPIGFLSDVELRQAIGSFLAVFPASTLWYNRHAEFILVGSPTRMPQLTAARLEDLAPNGTIDADMRAAGGHGRVGLAAHFLMGPSALKRLAASTPVLRDDKPTLEYGAARNEYRPSRHRETILGSLEEASKVLDKALTAQIEPFWTSVTALRWEYLDATLKGPGPRSISEDADAQDSTIQKRP